jgi:hypothetical protein
VTDEHTAQRLDVPRLGLANVAERRHVAEVGDDLMARTVVSAH